MYGAAYTLQEFAALMELALERPLDDELGVARIAVRRVMQQLQEELTPQEFARLVSLVFTGVNTIARLMKARSTLSTVDAGDLAAEIGGVLDEISAEWGIKL